jgi:tetratricopeptide (TPR) repeat protein
VKRALLVGGLLAVAALGVVAAERLGQQRQFRRLMAAGDLALQEGQTYAAIEAFSGALALRPESMAAYYRRGEAYAAQGSEENAVRDLKEARRLAPLAPQPLAALGRVYEQAGNHAQAAEWYAQAAEHLQDADPALLYALALARYRAGAPAAARDPLQRALAGDATLAQAHYLLGVVLRDAGAPADAVHSLEQAVRLAPSLIGAREELADLYRERGQVADERGQLSTLLTLDPQVDRYIALALADLRTGAYEEALASLDRAEPSAPGDSRVALARGRVYLARAERDGDRTVAARALEALERALAGTARRSEGLALFGRALHLSGDAIGAERLLRDATATSPVDPEAFAFLADAAEQLGHSAVAFDALRRLDAVEGDTVPTGARAARARRMGALAVDAGDAHGAVEYLAMAASHGHRDARTLGLLARAYWLAGQPKRAREVLDEALTLDSRSAELRRLSRTIR